MTTHDELVAAFGELLPGYRLDPNLSSGPATVRVGDGVLGGPIIVIPDIHLADGKAGDVFFNGHPENPKRLLTVLQGVQKYVEAQPDTIALQLGDWFDVWRTNEHDANAMVYGPIQNAAVYQDILDIDAAIGLAHVIGNHDASFLHAVPDLRATQAGAFRLGGWLGANVYAMHGHQTDIQPPANSPTDEFVVAAATVLAKFVPGVDTIEAYIDRSYGAGTVVGAWLLSLFGLMRDDPPPVARPRDTRANPPDPNANFVVRENADLLVTIASHVAAQSLPVNPKTLRLLLVGHSHDPCVAWSPVTTPGAIVVDAGAWVYDQANILLGAGDRVSVFNVVPR